MTIPPKARRFHASPNDSALTGSQGRQPVSQHTPSPAAQTRSPAAASVAGKEQKAPSAPDKTSASAEDAAFRERLMGTDPNDDGFGDLSMFDQPAENAPQAKKPAAGGANTAKPAGAQPELSVDEKLAAIRAENLSQRQLRIARRIATLHKIEVNSDEEAILQLRERGIDPSHRAALTQILADEGNKVQTTPAPNTPAVLLKRPKLPAIAAPAALPSREQLTEEKRLEEIARIQRDLARRRRRRMLMLVFRLLLFIALPTALAGWYYFKLASPLYATDSQFQIQQAEAIAGGTGSASMLAASPLALNTDAVAIQSYLTSRDAMNRMDEDMNFKAIFQDPSLDPLRRLAPDATNEDAYKVYKDSVVIGYDPTEGVVNMEVIAPTADLSLKFSETLLKYAEEQVDNLTSRLRNDQMKGATANYSDAEAKVLAAQNRVQELQEQLGVLDPLAEGTVIMNQVATLEGEMNQKQLELGQLLANANPVQSRVAGLRGDIERLKEMIGTTRQQLTEGSDQRNSLAKVTGELRIAEGDLVTRQNLLASAAQQLEVAQIEANKQVRYLSLTVPPIPPDEATYPKAFQNTFVALLIFSGIYLILSLTASILREQVSS